MQRSYAPHRRVPERVRLDGAEVAVYREGRGPPVLLLPHAWGLTAPFLIDAMGPARKYVEIVTFDPPGVGASPTAPAPAPPAPGAPPPTRGDVASVVSSAGGNGARHPAPAPVAEVARLGAALLDALDLRDVTVLGHAVAGLSALMLLRDRPERVARAALVSAYARGRFTMGTPEGEVEAALVRDVAARWARVASGDGTADDALALMRALPPVLAMEDGGAALVLEEIMKRESPEALLARFPAANREVRALDLRPALPGIRTPTWVVGGAADALAPIALQEEVARAMPDARFSRYAGASHVPFFEKPAVFHRHFREFAHGRGFPRSAARL